MYDTKLSIKQNDIRNKAICFVNKLQKQKKLFFLFS